MTLMRPSGPTNSLVHQPLQLRLYVAGNSPNSARALGNLRAICRACLDDNAWHLEVVDVLADPMRAVEDQILVTPTLLRVTPPKIQIIGDLSERDRVLYALGLADRDPSRGSS